MAPHNEIKFKNSLLKNEIFIGIDITDIKLFFESLDKKSKGYFKKYLMNIRNTDNWKENYYNYVDFMKLHLKDRKTFHHNNYTFVKLKFNFTDEETKNFINDYRIRHSNTIDGFILRHGEEKGKELFAKFQKNSITRSYATCDEYEIKSSSVWCKEFYIKRGYDEETAINMAKEFNRKNSGANKWYWIGKGYNDEEIEEIMSVINSKKAYGIKQYIERYGDEWYTKWEERQTKYRETIGAVTNENIPEFISYKNECIKFTNLSVLIYGNEIENLHLRGRINGYQLDHIYSIKMGFLSNIDPEIIGHITNLRCIPSFDNESKGQRCDKSIDELFEDYNSHESKKNYSNRK